MKRVYCLSGWRNYSGGVCCTSIIALIVTPFLCSLEEYEVTVITQVVRLGGLHVFYIYEQEKATFKNKK